MVENLENRVNQVLKEDSFLSKVKNKIKKILNPRNWLLAGALAYTTLAASCSSRINPNYAPNLKHIDNIVVNEGETININASATDPENDPITYDLEGTINGKNFTKNGENSFTCPTDYNDAGTYSIRVYVSDGINKPVFQDVNITINNVNRDPILDFIPDQTVDETDLITVTLNSTDPDNDPLTYSAQGNINGKTFTQNNNIFTLQTDYTDAGTYNIRFLVNDGNGGTDYQDVTFTINDINAPPELTTPIIPNPTPARETEKITVTITSTDLDGDTVNHSIEPTGYFTKINNTTFEWTPDYSTTNKPTEQFTFTAKADDGRGGIDTETFSITIKDGKIAVQRKSNTKYDIILLNPDGTTEQNITNTPNFNETNPQFTPDGKKLIFLADYTGNTEAYELDLETLIKTQLTNDPGATNPKIGPNQQYIYFERNKDIWRRDYPTGANLTNLTNHILEDTDYCIHPNGNEMLFATRRYGGYHQYLQIARLDLTNLTITRVSGNVGDDRHPCYHLTKQKFFFERDTGGTNGIQIYMADLPFGAYDTSVSDGFLPDDILPVFHELNGKDYVYYNSGNNIVRTNFSANSFEQITNTGDIIGTILAIPKKIIYVRDLGSGNYEIFEANMDGTNEKRLTNNTQEDINPAWK